MRTKNDDWPFFHCTLSSSNFESFLVHLGMLIHININRRIKGREGTNGKVDLDKSVVSGAKRRKIRWWPG